MTTDSKDRPTASKSGMPSWLKRVILFASLGAVLVIVYFILAAFVPRWWAERIGGLSDGRVARGITWGLFFGGLSTLVPLLLVLLAVLVWRKRGGRVIAGLGDFAHGAGGGFAAAPVLGDGGLQHVVDGDHPEHAVVLVDYRDGVEVVVGHQQCDVGQIGVGADPHRVGIHECPNTFGSFGLQQGDH